MPDSPSLPSIPLETVLSTLNLRRWTILGELADGSSLMVSELAAQTGYAPDVVSKQLSFLRKAGIVINPRGRLYEIAPQFLADKSQGLLDFGWCTLRMNFGK